MALCRRSASDGGRSLLAAGRDLLKSQEKQTITTCGRYLLLGFKTEVPFGLVKKFLTIAAKGRLFSFFSKAAFEGFRFLNIQSPKSAEAKTLMPFPS